MITAGNLGRHREIRLVKVKVVGQRGEVRYAAVIGSLSAFQSVIPIGPQGRR
jgi:hypothetical protein